MRSSRAFRSALLFLLIVTALLFGAAAAEAPVISVLSGPPEWVSGGDARLLVTVPAGVPLAEVNVLQGGADVTARFAPATGAHALEGVVSGLSLGDTLIEARAAEQETSLTLTNHPVSGPLFSGPQQEVFVCSSERHRGNAKLGDPLDEECSLETRVDFLYLSTESGNFEPFDPAGPEPANLALTTTRDGLEVPFIVRWERGTLNRFIYSIAVLSPGTQNDEPDLSAWNGRLIKQFQGGVAIGHYQGSPSRRYMLNPRLLGDGYAVTYSTGTSTGEHYNLIVGGETALMVKDRFVSAYGSPEFTIGLGGSGGGIQQYIYAQNHPGLLDGLIPQYSYSDMVTQTIHVGDCELLERYMDARVAEDPDSIWATWTNRTWLQGLNASDTLPNEYAGGAPGLTECINGWRGLSPLALNPYFGTVPGISNEQQEAVEWTHFADAVNVYGLRDDGFARRTWDNTGVQYGLQALSDGNITPADFLDLNAQVGSWKDQADMVQEGCPFIDQLCEDPEQLDPWSARNMNLADGSTPAPRSEADSGAIAAAHASGLVFRGELNLPTIDWRPYLEEQLDMHNTSQSFATRSRLRSAGTPEEVMAIWFTDVTAEQPEFDQTPLALEVLDEWLVNLRDDPAQDVVAARPDRAVDSCFDAAGDLIHAGADAWNGILDDGPAGLCTEALPVYGTSRTVAGGPVAGDVFKCALHPVEAAIASGLYGSWRPDAAEREQLQAIFPTGVCDYSLGEAGF